MSASNTELSYFYLLQKAWPIILANAAVPILGLVDTAIIGHYGQTQDLGGIAVGAIIFSFIYWGFGFLRMGTTGFVAQAEGAGQPDEVRAVFGRALILALCIGTTLTLLQWPIGSLALALFSASPGVEEVAQSYFSIRIWGAPATLSTFALMGVLVGLGRSRLLLVSQCFLNGLNILLDFLFAGYLDMGAEGIALGTVIAEWTTVLLVMYLLYKALAKDKAPAAAFWEKSLLLDKARLRAMLVANTDIMIRTLLLIFSFAWFTNQSAAYGDVVLAANHILLQLISFSAFFLDGYAFVVESLVGKAIGAKDAERFSLAVKRSTILAFISAVLLALILFFAGSIFIAWLTDLPAVQIEAQSRISLVAIYVFFSFAAFQLDGIFIGVSYTRQMRNAAFMSIAVYMLAWWFLADRFGVAGLWWAMILYVCARADALLFYYPSLLRAVKASRT